MNGRIKIRIESKKINPTKSYKGQKVVENHDHPCLEGTWHLEEDSLTLLLVLLLKPKCLLWSISWYKRNFSHCFFVCIDKSIKFIKIPFYSFTLSLIASFLHTVMKEKMYSFKIIKIITLFFLYLKSYHKSYRYKTTTVHQKRLDEKSKTNLIDILW